MSEEPTENLTGGNSFEDRVLAELAKLNSQMTAFNERLTSLEDKVEARLHDTRPVWESVLTRLDAIESRLNSIETRLEGVESRVRLIDSKMDVLNNDLLEMRGEVNLLKKLTPPAA